MAAGGLAGGIEPEAKRAAAAHGRRRRKGAGAGHAIC